MVAPVPSVSCCFEYGKFIAMLKKRSCNLMHMDKELVLLYIYPEANDYVPEAHVTKVLFHSQRYSPGKGRGQCAQVR